MFFRQLIDPDLGCCCYVLGDAGVAVVVDPGVRVDDVIAAAALEGARITAILETHVHADHVSGRAVLAQRTGAEVRLAAGGGADPAAGRALHPGEVVAAGGVRIEAIATPGHRPEHLAFLVTDTARDPAPAVLLTGDSVLVGDLARPDLAVDAASGARTLHASVRALAALPGELELWPGHVGGSLCGGDRLSRRPSSTLGYELRVNPLLSEADPQRFGERLLAELPARPPTVATVVARNRSAAPLAQDRVPRLDLGAAAALAAGGAVVVDGRQPDAFDAGHLPGALNLPLAGAGVGTRAGWLVDPDDVVVALGASPEDVRELALRLTAVGLTVAGAAAHAELHATEPASGRSTALSVTELAATLDELTVIDVRDDAEWARVHLPGSVHLPLARLRAGAAELPAQPFAVACAAGVRAAAAASLLRRLGHDARRVRDGGIQDIVALARGGLTG